jgi:hypothetical protein
MKRGHKGFAPVGDTSVSLDCETHLRTETGQSEIVISDHEPFAQHHEKTATGRRHHVIPENTCCSEGPIDPEGLFPPGHPKQAGDCHQIRRDNFNDV